MHIPWSRLAEARLKKISKDSLIYEIAGKVSANLKKHLHSIVIKNIVDVKEGGKVEVIDKCMPVLFLSFMEKTCDDSGVMALINILKRAFETEALKNTGLIIVSAISANLIFAVLLRQGIGLVGMFLRCSLLLIGFACLFFNMRFGDIKSTSFTIRLLKSFYENGSK